MFIDIAKVVLPEEIPEESDEAEEAKASYAEDVQGDEGEQGECEKEERGVVLAGFFHGDLLLERREISDRVVLR